MRIEHEGKVYETVISKPIMEGDLYYDSMFREVKKCNSYICFDPWTLKLELINKENKENEKIK